MPPAPAPPAGSLSSRDAFDECDPEFRVPPGNVQKGQKLFKKHCAQCHSIYPDNRITRAGQTALGPTLFNIYGRASGLEDIQNKQGTERVDGVLWIDGPLMNYMKNPRVLGQVGLQMNFRGLPNFQDRVDIIHYMKTLDWGNEEIGNPPREAKQLGSGEVDAEVERDVRRTPLDRMVLTD